MIKFTISYELKFLGQLSIYHGIRAGGHQFKVQTLSSLYMPKLKILVFGPLIKGGVCSHLRGNVAIMVK